MVLRRALAPIAVAVLFGASCGSEPGVGLRVLSSEVRPGATPKVAIVVSVTADCFFSVLLNADLKASGRWANGTHEVLIPGYLLLPRDNVVRVDVAADDGSAARVEEPLGFCETAEIVCGDGVADAGVEPDAGDPGPVCAPCTGDDACGGLPNECVFLYPDEPGVCGTYCGDDYICPRGFVCTQFQDEVHTSLLCFPPAPDYACP